MPRHVEIGDWPHESDGSCRGADQQHREDHDLDGQRFPASSFCALPRFAHIERFFNALLDHLFSRPRRHIP